MVIGVHRVNCVEYWMFGPGIIMSCFPLQEGTLTGGKMKGVPWQRKGDLPPIWAMGIHSMGLSSRCPCEKACGTWCTRSLDLQAGMECSPGWQEPQANHCRQVFHGAWFLPHQGLLPESTSPFNQLVNRGQPCWVRQLASWVLLSP